MKTLNKILMMFMVTVSFILISDNVVQAATSYNEFNDSIYYEKGIAKKDINKMVKYTELIPSSIYDDFIANNGKIYLVNSIHTINTYKSIQLDDETNNYYDAENKIYYVLNRNVKDGILTFFAMYSYEYINASFDPIILKNDYYKNSTVVLTYEQTFIRYFKEYCLNKSSLDVTMINYLEDLFTNDNTVNKPCDLSIYDDVYVDANRREATNYMQYNDYIFYDDSIKIGKVNSLSAAISIVPKTIIDKLIEKGFIFIFTDEKIFLNGYANSLYDTQNYSGMTHYKNKFIVIDVSKSNSEFTLIHEIGHAIDCTFSNEAFLSNKPEFTQLYCNNKNVYNDPYEAVGYSTSNAKEFFACSFKDYILFHDRLESKYQDIYTYMDKLIASL